MVARIIGESGEEVEGDPWVQVDKVDLGKTRRTLEAV